MSDIPHDLSHDSVRADAMKSISGLFTIARQSSSNESSECWPVPANGR